MFQPGFNQEIKFAQHGKKVGEIQCRGENTSQMVAERSVNCSLVSLPRAKEKLSLPLCGPLEGLALMYILKEQGSLVAYDEEMLSKFESGLRAECPAKCHFHYYQPVVVSPARTNSIGPHLTTYKGVKEDTRLNSRLSTSDGKRNDVAILEIRQGKIAPLNSYLRSLSIYLDHS